MDDLPNIHPGPGRVTTTIQKRLHQHMGCRVDFSLQFSEFNINDDSCEFYRSDPGFSYHTPKGGGGETIETPWNPELDKSKRISDSRGGTETTSPDPC